ncbi:hypothetical protein N8T08_005227 [Aspergillus melleus]|uniref:Uncharacterized protein n=1 Tax=Aspergillus melleus TaxID=138277 RepID=A0ACC3BGD9_9EURO|nr:hypothetical protein N8T08_005227 [Aspergillus melleus]
MSTWQEKAEIKRLAAASKIPSDWRLPDSTLSALTTDSNVLDIPRASGLLSPRELEITDTTDATLLLSNLAAREYTAVEVTTAFSKRAAIAQQLVCCLTETFFDEALERAKFLDEHLARTGKTVGPLHGLPISLKDSFNVVGQHTTLGFISFLENPPQKGNAAVVDILLAAGAVLYVKTNIPQTMMTADSHNNVFGRVLNPHRRNLTAGGSTGGEGALVAMRGSILGVGTDVAGSIRIPALCCGLVGFKPSVGRVPYGGQATAGRSGLVGVVAVAGPLCHSVRDAEMLLRVITEGHPEDLDDVALPIPWREQPDRSEPLRIGLLHEDQAYPLHPSMHRALTQAAAKLAEAGHTIVDLSGKTPSLVDIARLTFQYFGMDPDKTLFSHILRGEEPFIPSLAVIGTGGGMEMPEPTLRNLYDMNTKRIELAEAMRKAYVENKVDVILSPGFQGCAVPHDTYDNGLYTTMPNLLDYPACILPFGHADEKADAPFVRDVDYKPSYKPTEIEGAPCHVQLIGRRLQDEKLAQHVRQIERILKA